MEGIVGDERRNVGLDVLKILLAIVIFMFHSSLALDIDYGVLAGVARMGAVFMSAFFMLSGFTLYIVYRDRDFFRAGELKDFYIKRLASIMPAYYVSILIYIIFLRWGDGDVTRIEDLILLPIELFGLQSTNYGFMTYSHNSGTWFVSCILICYFQFPFLLQIDKLSSKKMKKCILLIAYLILVYVPLIAACHLERVEPIYRNPFYRGMEFICGMLLASISGERQKLVRDLADKRSRIKNGIIAIVMIFSLYFVITFLVDLNIGIGDYMLYGGILIPLFGILMIAVCNMGIIGRIGSGRIVSIAYSFYLAQLFSNDFSLYLIERYHIEKNVEKMSVAFLCCCLFSILLRYLVELPAKRFILKRCKIK